MFLCEVTVCVNIAAPRPVGKIYTRVYNVFFFFFWPLLA